MKDVMLDLETLGTAPGSVILSIGAVVFDENGLGEEFYRVVNTDSCVAAGLTIDASTLEWWERQTPEAREVLEQAKVGGGNLHDVLLAFTCWLNEQAPLKEIRLWGNGSDFDNVLVERAYAAVKSLYPLRFYNHRCYRTLKNLITEVYVPLERQGTYHNALDDAKTQAVHAGRILKLLQKSLAAYSLLDEIKDGQAS